MAIDLNAVTSDKAKATVEWNGESMEVVYRPSMITPETLGQLDKTSTVDETLEWIVSVLVSWDLKQGTKKVPVSINAMKKLPISLIRAVVEALASASGEADPEA